MYVAMEGARFRYVVYTFIFLGYIFHMSQAKTQFWSNADGMGGTVFYRISDALKSCTKKTLLAAIRDVNLTNSDGSMCIQFVETDGRFSPTMLAYVDFQPAFGRCPYHINIPRIPTDPNPSTTKLTIKVNDKCVTRPAFVYILARILGLPDEHTRPNRDDYISIHWDNIETEAISGEIYNKSSSDLWTEIGSMPYDFTSVTHIGPFEHALNRRKPTLSSRYEGVHFGDHLNLSVIDVMKIRHLYNCQPDTYPQRVMAGNRPIYCTFDLPLCGLVNDWTTSGIQWTKRRGPVSEEGPQTDHTNGDGWYMFANGTESSTARLVSITEVSPGDVCVSLYYYLENNSTTVKISQKESARNTVTQIREIDRNEEISWSEIRFSFTSAETWRLLIEADVTNSAVAIDDVMVQYGRCPSSNECDRH